MQLLRVHIQEKNTGRGIATCYYYFDCYLLLHLLLPITMYITSHCYSAITTCYFQNHILLPVTTGLITIITTSITTYYYLYYFSLLLSYYYLLLPEPYITTSY